MDARFTEQNPKNDKYQAVDSTAVYLTNVKNICTDNFIDNDTLTATMCNIMYALTIPFTATIGAGIKTVIDVGTRKPLLQNDMDDLILGMFQLNSQEVNELVDSIQDYNAQSSASIQLKKDLQQIYDSELKEKKEIEINAEKQSSKNDGFRLFSVNARCESSLEEVLNRYRDKKISAIVNYLNEPENVGKKMQQIILEKMNEITFAGNKMVIR